MGTVHYLDGRHNMLDTIDGLRDLVESGQITHLAITGVGLGKEDEIFYYKCNLLKDASGLSPLIGISQANVQQLAASFLHHLAHATAAPPTEGGPSDKPPPTGNIA